MPQQIKSLLVLCIILIAGFITFRILLVPESFGEYGHYRANALNTIIAREIKYAGQQACMDCHEDIMEIKNKSFHRNLSCESCHGPSAKHAEAPDTTVPTGHKQKGACYVCHSYNPSRPTGFPQIEVIKHHPTESCISCHNPHDPVPPHIPEECNACHSQIARTQSISPHSSLKCIECHETTQDHILSPKLIRPQKPSSRSFCGKCHDLKADSSKEIPRIDISTHGGQYLCWQCHYPHFPEAGR